MFLQDTLKTAFQMRPIDAHKQDIIFQNLGAYCLFSKKTGEIYPNPC